MTVTKSTVIRSIHAADPGLSVLEISRAAECSPSHVRATLRRAPRSPRVGAQHVIQLPDHIDRAVCALARERGESLGAVVGRLVQAGLEVTL